MPGSVLAQEIARYIDGRVSLDARRGAQENACFAARAAAKLDQRAALRKQRGDLRRVLLQKTELASRRIIFGQLSDAVEQTRAGQVVKIFRR
jgi:hypothetical protein